MKVSLLAISLVICIAYVQCQVPEHKITNLPGVAPNQTLTDMYAGYISLENGHHYFYWFIESQRNPETDPVLLWLNGGPGCSSLDGLLTENGPFYPDAHGNLIPNPYSWNTVANVLYVESPAGVGFSYMDNRIGFNDNTTALDNYNVVSKFFSLYPKFAKNDFYISGESYAGHYLPQLAYLIMLNTKTNPNVPPQSNFKGFLVGNPATDMDIDFGKPLTHYYQTHGLLRLDDETGDVRGRIDPYNILADVCQSKWMLEKIRFPHPLIDRLRDAERGKRYVRNPDPCIDDHVHKYLNTQAVQKALHVKPTNWIMCGGPSYQFNYNSIIPYYQQLMENTNYKILVYSGDQDSVVNFISTETWILGLKRKVVNKWGPWMYERFADPDNHGSQVGGWGIDFDRISFRTVKGAGHMVPWDQPASSLQMLKDFLNRK